MSHNRKEAMPTEENNLYPTTRKMSDDQVSERQTASRRVTVTKLRVPTQERFATPKTFVNDEPRNKAPGSAL